MRSLWGRPFSQRPISSFQEWNFIGFHAACCCSLPPCQYCQPCQPGQELMLRQTKLSQEEHSVTDKIEEAARVSPATDAALASCSEKVRGEQMRWFGFSIRTMERTSRQHCDDSCTSLYSRCGVAWHGLKATYRLLEAVVGHGFVQATEWTEDIERATKDRNMSLPRSSLISPCGLVVFLLQLDRPVRNESCVRRRVQV